MNAAAADVPMATSEETVNTVSPVRVMARSPFRPTTHDNTGTDNRRSEPFGERGVFPGQRWKTRPRSGNGVHGQRKDRKKRRNAWLTAFAALAALAFFG